MPTKTTDTQEAPVENMSLGAAENVATAGFAIAIASIFTNFFSFGIMAIAGLVLSVIGRVQTKKAGKPSNVATAGIIISGIVMFLTLIAYAVFFFAFIMAGSTHQISCDDPAYMRHNVCQPMYDDQSAPSRSQPQQFDIGPNSL